MIPKAPAAVLPQARTPLGNLEASILVAISGKAKKDPLNHLRQLLAIDLTAMSCATNSPAESPGPSRSRDHAAKSTSDLVCSNATTADAN